MPETTEDVVKKCPNCGSALVFSPQDGTLKCPACGHVAEAQEDSDSIASYENDLCSLIDREDLVETPEAITIKCPACGAESRLPDNVVADECPYCKNPIVASDKTVKSIRPQGVVPFSIDRGEASEIFGRWIKGLWFAPGSIKGARLHESLKGTYSPTWTFDFKTRCTYTGKRGTEYQETIQHTSNGKTTTRTVTRVSWRSVSGVVYNEFDDILVPASSMLCGKAMDSVENWRLDGAVDYAQDKIRGFTELSYDLPLKSGLEKAKAKASPTIEKTIRRDIGGDRQKISSMDVSYTGLTFRQILLPDRKSVV